MKKVELSLTKYDIYRELGNFIEQKMEEREAYLRKTGKIKGGRKLSRNYVGKEILGVSGVWFSKALNGEVELNDDLLLKLANFLEIDEHELFRKARRVHPDVLERVKKEYLGERYYV